MAPEHEHDEVAAVGSAADVPVEQMTQTDRKIAALRNYYETLLMLWSLENAAAHAALLAGATEDELGAVMDQAESDHAEADAERPAPGEKPN